MARIASGNVVCPQCHNYGSDPEKGTCPKCNKRCDSGFHTFNSNYYDSCPYCEAAVERVHDS